MLKVYVMFGSYSWLLCRIAATEGVRVPLCVLRTVNISFEVICQEIHMKMAWGSHRE